MKKTSIYFVIWLCLFAAKGFCSVDLSIQAPSTVMKGSMFDAELIGAGADTIIGAQVILQFDPALLQISNIIPQQNVVVTPVNTANSSGEVILVYLDMTSIGKTADNIGWLAKVHFQAIEKGSGNISINNETMVVGPESQTLTGSLTGSIVTIQSGVSGQVQTSITGQIAGIPNATVTVLENGQTTMTDAEGNFTLTGLESGNYSLKVEKENFNTFVNGHIKLSHFRSNQTEPHSFIL